MKYIALIAQESKDGVACLASCYGTLAEARSACYMELASGLISDTLVGDMCAVLDSDGHMYSIDHVDGKAKTE